MTVPACHGVTVHHGLIVWQVQRHCSQLNQFSALHADPAEAFLAFTLDLQCRRALNTVVLLMG